MIKGCRFSGGGLWGAKGRRWTSWLTNTGFGPSAVMGIRAVHFLVWAIAAAFRPRVRLIAENLCPRHPLRCWFSADTVLLNIGKCLTFRFLLHRGRFHDSPGTEVSAFLSPQAVTAELAAKTLARLR